MRALFLLVLAVVTGFAEDLPSSTASPEVPANLSIPAQLSKTLDTDKCKAGDIVEMKTLEPVLIGKGLVMPQNVTLRGRVVGAASRQNDKPSWVVFVIERAEWKNHNIPLHAFVMGQITMKERQLTQNASGLDAATNQPESVRRRRSAREATQSNPGNDLAVAMSRPPQDVSVQGVDIVQPNYQRLDDVHIFQDKTGTVFLLSQKSHLKLPSGTMLMLRNQPAANAGQEGKIAGTMQ